MPGRFWSRLLQQRLGLSARWADSDSLLLRDPTVKPTLRNQGGRQDCFATSARPPPPARSRDPQAARQETASPEEIKKQRAIQQHAGFRAEAAAAMMDGKLLQTQWINAQQNYSSATFKGIPPSELEQVIQYALANPLELYPGQGPPMQPEDGTTAAEEQGALG